MQCEFSIGCTEEATAHCLECSPEIQICLIHSTEHQEKSGHSPAPSKKILKPSQNSQIKEIELLIIKETSTLIKQLKKTMSRSLKVLKNLKKTFDTLTKIPVNKNLSKNPTNDPSSIHKKAAQSPKPDFLFAFKQNTEKFLIFDPETQKFTKKKILNLSPQGILPVFCQLSADTIFLCGGYSTKYLKTAYILNFLKGEAREVESGLARNSAAGEIFDKKVYVFGGWTDKPIADCSYFDLESESWGLVQSLPVAVTNTSTLLIDDYILIAGRGKSTLFRYVIKEDCYETLKAGIEINYKNILIPFRDSVFLVMFSGTLRACLGDFTNWVFIDGVDNSDFYDFSTSKPVVRGEHAYFVMWHRNSVMCFNCVDYSVKTVLTMSK